MSKSEQLSNQRLGTVINNISKNEDKACYDASVKIFNSLSQNFPDVSFSHKKTILNIDLQKITKKLHPNDSFEELSDKRGCKPDGGVIYAIDKNGINHPLYVSEVKHQGTNDKRIAEGKAKQARGNAIERFGKNLNMCYRLFDGEDIFPVTCFCSGCDFQDDYIKDKLHSLNNFKQINKNLMNEHLHSASFFTKEQSFTEDEMFETGYEMASKQLDYFKSKYKF